MSIRGYIAKAGTARKVTGVALAGSFAATALLFTGAGSANAATVDSAIVFCPLGGPVAASTTTIIIGHPLPQPGPIPAPHCPPIIRVPLPVTTPDPIEDPITPGPVTAMKTGAWD
ncbi:hypothetical protein ACIQGZ_27115 [Streptomyces sp. NPDC092296]|uniref:hypothetical protein n=1 Tax=Streptomyces sp. NPDC092296 TaxID=3366012 RepID=UPI00380BF38C